ncbi:MAG: hypothetical protein Q8Q18_03770 [bacterium]|nr:hypothetical protein [bacterium]
MFTLYNVISADGFIANADGREDFIPDQLWSVFLGMCAKYGAVVMGRKTYQAIVDYDKALTVPLEELNIQRIVISTREDIVLKKGYILFDSPEEATRVASGALVSSGPMLNNYLLEKGLVKMFLGATVSNPILSRDVNCVSVC